MLCIFYHRRCDSFRSDTVACCPYHWRKKEIVQDSQNSLPSHCALTLEVSLLTGPSKFLDVWITYILFSVFIVLNFFFIVNYTLILEECFKSSVNSCYKNNLLSSYILQFSLSSPIIMVLCSSILVVPWHSSMHQIDSVSF